MGLIKLAKLSDDDLYEKIILNHFKRHPDEADPDWEKINAKALKVKDRYKKFAKYKTNKNIKRGLVGAAAIGLISRYAYKEHKDKK
jgi:hypothetical protein